ncbi:hypothetical protein CLOM_g22811 [Closterium sp. NIES-68]|nr:hypothetical protein CLOM_g22811 [Closterium sp. NIES-68]GJP71275.1 hypothetical protein CLOP_g2124 [Closterium sp. NIES-67]
MSNEGWRNLQGTLGGSARESTNHRNGDGDGDGGEAMLRGMRASAAKSMPHAGQPILSFTSGSLSEEYELGEKLGEGHFGSTYRCRHRKTGEEFAVKQMSKTRLLMLGTPLAEVKREVGILYHLAGHPHIVQVQAAFEDSKSVAIVMELCQGGELYDRIIAKGHYSECDAARLISTMVSVVDYCHTMNVVHRDLKPENFLFANGSDDAPLKTIDFGLSLFFTPGEPISAGLAGSPLYLAPEMVRTNGCHYGPEVDVWSAGVILYMLLCGYCPFPTDLPTMDELFCAIMYDEIDYESDPWPLISDDAKEVVQGMLDRNPTTRWTAKQVLEHPWVSEVGVAPDTPMDPTVVTRIKRYAAMTHIRKLASQVVAQHLTEEEILGMREIFNQIDMDQSGSLSLDEMRRGLQKMGAKMNEGELRELYSAMDINDSDSISVNEFFAATLGLNRMIKEENLHQAFQYFDKDGSGFITRDELSQVCEEFGIGPENVEEMMQEVDVNKDDCIDYNEFVTMMHRHSIPDHIKSSSIGKDKLALLKVQSSLEKVRRSPTI